MPLHISRRPVLIPTLRFRNRRKHTYILKKKWKRKTIAFEILRHTSAHCRPWMGETQQSSLSNSPPGKTDRRRLAQMRFQFSGLCSSRRSYLVDLQHDEHYVLSRWPWRCGTWPRTRRRGCRVVLLVDNGNVLTSENKAGEVESDVEA